jgi:predicted NBD/HSP70 family sugar kinase
LRTLTEEHVLRALMEHGKLTRAEIAAYTGISKPTNADAVRRLVVADLFATLGLRRTDSTAIDVDVLRSRTSGSDGAAILRALAVAASGALMAAVALADPGTMVVGGSWGRDEKFLVALRDEFAHFPRAITVVASGVATEPQLVGARAAGLEQLRDEIVAAASGRR